MMKSDLSNHHHTNLPIIVRFRKIMMMGSVQTYNNIDISPLTDQETKDVINQVLLNKNIAFYGGNSRCFSMNHVMNDLNSPVKEYIELLVYIDKIIDADNIIYGTIHISDIKQFKFWLSVLSNYVET